MVIYLVLMSPSGSSDLPESTTGRRIAFYSVLLRIGFTCALPVTSQAVSSYLAFPPLPAGKALQAVYFCCTGLGVTSTRCYLESCPMKPGLSSPAAFRHLQPRPSVPLIFGYSNIYLIKCQKKKFGEISHLTVTMLNTNMILVSEQLIWKGIMA